jgi:hypothetical protein
MNKILVTFMLLLLSVSYGYSQNEVNKEETQANNDSIVIFTFRANNDMFFAAYQNNEFELYRLLKITKQYDAEIKEGRLPVYVSGYNYSSINQQRNLALAKIWSNRVKSELIVRRKLKEEHFITRNYAETYRDLNYAVVVMLKFPRDIIKEEVVEEVPEEVVEEVVETPILTEEPIVLKDVVENEETGETSEIEVVIPPKEELTEEHVAPKAITGHKNNSSFHIQTNLLYWLATTPNIGIEWRPNAEKPWGILLNGAWTHWDWEHKTRKYRMWLVNPEVRYYLSDKWFVGSEFHIGEWNVKFDETGRQGEYIGGGVTGGYRWPISSVFDIDFTLGLGYTRFNKEYYEMVGDLHIGTRPKTVQHFWGPTQLGITLRYKLK